MIEQPLVSVLMTAYNREKYVAEAIESVLASTYNNIELIIVDDHSDDNTVQIARTYEEKDSRVKVFVNEKNLGDYPNRNKAGAYAKGELVMYVDSDDTITPDAIEYIVASFKKFPEAQHSTIYFHKDIPTATLMQPVEAIKKHLYENNMLAGGPGARVFRRTFFIESGMFPIKYGPANDLYFNLKTTSAEAILLLPYSYLRYRIHDLQENKNQFSYLHNGYSYFNEIMLHSDIPLDEYARKQLRFKNKRRFLINTAKYFFKTLKLKNTIKAYQLAGFTLKDAVVGIFH